MTLKNIGEIFVQYLTGYPFFTISRYSKKVDLLNDFTIIFPLFVILCLIRIILTKVFHIIGIFLIRFNKGEKYYQENKKRAIYFSLHGYKTVFHFFISLYAWWNFKNSGWWYEYGNNLFSGELDVSFELKFWSMIQIAFHLQLLFSIFYEEKRKDHIEMLVHHIIVIVLSVGTYKPYTEVGVLSTQVHDVSDVFLSTVQMANQVKSHGLIITVTALSNLISWIYFRFWVLGNLIYLMIRVTWLGCKMNEMIGGKILTMFSSVLPVLHVIWFFMIIKSYSKFFGGIAKGKDVDDVDETEYTSVDDKKKK